MRKFFLAAAALVLAAPAAAASPPLPSPPPPQPPQVFIAIDLSGLSPDILETYRPLFTSGLARVQSETGIPEAYRTGRQIAVESGPLVGIAGLRPDQHFQWSQTGFVSASPGPLPASVSQGNAAIARAIATTQPALVPPPECAARGNAASSAFSRRAGDTAAFHDSPEGDGATLAVSAALVRELGLGGAAKADALAIGLSAPEAVARKYGANSQEMCLELLALDRDLGDFLSRLDGWGLTYTISLTRP